METVGYKTLQLSFSVPQWKQTKLKLNIMSSLFIGKLYLQLALALFSLFILPNRLMHVHVPIWKL